MTCPYCGRPTIRYAEHRGCLTREVKRLTAALKEIADATAEFYDDPLVNRVFKTATRALREKTA